MKHDSLALEHHARSRLQLLAWMNERVPPLILETAQ
jgi:hypothetical protein